MNRYSSASALAGIGLVLCAADQFGGVWLFPIASMLLFASFTLVSEEITASIRARDMGPRWVWIGMGVIVLSAGAHAVIGHTLRDLMGLMFILWIPVLFLLGRHIRDMWPIAVAGAVEAVYLIVGKVTVLGLHDGGFTENHHLAAMLVIMGALLAPQRWRLGMLALATPAVLISGSQQGLVALGVLGVVMLVRERRAAVVMGVVGIVALVVMGMTGVFGKLYGDFTVERFTSREDVIHDRQTVYADAIMDGGILWGEGWSWDIDPDEVPHNVPLLVAKQLGMLAGMAWIGLMVMGMVRAGRKEKGMFAVIMVFGAFDHMLWTYLFPWTWVLLGMNTVRVRMKEV